MRRLAARFALLAALSGCATWVVVPHVQPPRALAPGTGPRLARLAVIVDVPPPEVPGVLAGAAHRARRALGGDAAVALPLDAAGAYAVAEDVAAALASPASRVAAYRLGDAGSTGFLDAVGATAVLRITPGDLEGTQEEAVIEGADGRRARAWILRARLPVAWRLDAWPEGAGLAARELVPAAEARADQPVKLEPWTRAQAGLRRAWIGGLRADLLPLGVGRMRLVQKGPTPALKAGRSAAADGRWEAARAAWEDEERRTGDWRAAWNLGVAGEARGDWTAARSWYEAASARPGPGADERASLAAYLADVAEDAGAAPPPGPPGGPPAAGKAWFAEPVAVLPFSNETVSVDAPGRIRDEAARELRRKGYAVLPPDDTARRLRDVGVTQGEHLRAVPPAAVSAAAGARLLLTGTVQKFSELNVGVYNLHAVVVAFRLLDGDGRVLWEAPGAGWRDLVAGPKDAGRMFLFGLAESALERITRSTLGEELGEAVLTGLAGLPSAPGARGPS